MMRVLGRIAGGALVWGFLFFVLTLANVASDVIRGAYQGFTCGMERREE